MRILENARVVFEGFARLEAKSKSQILAGPGSLIKFSDNATLFMGESSTFSVDGSFTVQAGLNIAIEKDTHFIVPANMNCVVAMQNVTISGNDGDVVLDGNRHPKGIFCNENVKVVMKMIEDFEKSL